MPPTSVRATILKRYTNLPALLALLQSRELSVLPPVGWEDKNDRMFMEQYARKSELATVLGLCFSQAAETFHHWKIFAPGASGVCIEFRKIELLQLIPSTGFRHKRVRYKKPVSLIAGYATVAELPFIKGWAYRDEKEYRIIYSSKNEVLEVKSFPFQLSTIRNIVVNPWLPPPLFEATRRAIHTIPGCGAFPITQSRVIDNEHWQAYARDA